MSTAPAPTASSTPRFNEIGWIMTFFGTAVGAGILYLPLQVGTADRWSFAVLSILIFPIIYLAHRSVLAMLLQGRAEQDYTSVVTLHCGPLIGALTTAVYFATFYAVLFTYSIGLNASMGDFLVHIGLAQTDPAEGPWLSLLILLSLAAVHGVGRTFILRLMASISVLLIIILVGISIYLIPHWNLTESPMRPSLRMFEADLFLVFPILVFSFVFFPATSSMVNAWRQSSGVDDVGKLNRILIKSTLLLMVFVLFFVTSSILALSPQEFEAGIRDNLNCLTILSHKEGLPRGMATLGILVGMLALTTSFIGVFFAVRETAHRMLNGAFSAGWPRSGVRNPGRRHQQLDRMVIVTVFISLWILTLLDPSVMSLFGLVVTPLVAVFLFVLPVLVLGHINGWRTLIRPAHFFVLCTGLLLLVSYQVGMLIKG